ncbi:MAG TPA: LamG domain-containing protein [Verrucomicrobiales bacterium]|nr:LamG domain-containing protein [Verrucomicrobiales bacterium]
MKLFLHSKSLGVLLILAGCTSASASLVNLYTFNGSNANDSVGGANGTVVDPGAVTATYFTSGNQRSLDLRGNTGQGSNSITEDAFVDLPNGIMTTAATTGTSGALSISVWVTVDTNRNWAEIYAFGTSNGGENTAGGGSSSPYLALIPSTGDNQSLRSTTHSASGVELSVSTAAAASLSTGVQHHLVTVYDQSGGVPGTISFYLDNALVGTGPIAGGLDLNTFTNNNNWLGRSMWPDPVFDGLINEVGIYNTALTAGEVSGIFNAGPAPIPEPGSAVLALAGLAACRRRRR